MNIRKFLLVFLTVISSSARAEWILYGEGHDVTAYYSPPANSKNLDNVKVWVLYNFNKVQQGQTVIYWSKKELTEVDCPSQSSRWISASWYSEQMGMGDLVYSFPSGDWGQIPSGSLTHNLYKIVCNQ